MKEMEKGNFNKESSLSEYLNFKREILEEGRAVYSCIITKEVSNRMNMAHGGLMLALADHAMGMAFDKTCNNYVTTDVNYRFLKAAPIGEKVYAEAKIVRQGRSIMVAECRLRCNGELIGIAGAQLYRLNDGK